MASGGAAGGGDPQWVLTRDRTGAATLARNALGVVAVLVAVVAALALLNSFFVDLAPGEPVDAPGDPSPGPESQGSEGDGRDACERAVEVLFWAFALLGVAAIVLFGAAVARREHHGGRIGSSVWGILAIVTAVLSALAYGLWRLMVVLCAGDLDCGTAQDGTHDAFLVTLGVTLVALGVGIVLAHTQRRNFLTTGWGLLGLLMALPTMVLGFTWFLVRTACADTLTCATRDAFLSTLAWTAGLAVAGAVVAVAAGVLVVRRWRFGFFTSGWGILVVVLLLLAAFAGAGWLFAKDVTAPMCDELTPPDEEPTQDATPPTCEERQDALRDRLVLAMLTVLAGGVVSGGVGMFLHRHDLRPFWSSPWAIGVYIAVALLVLLGLLYLMAGSMCAGPNDGPGAGDGGDGSGPGGGGGGPGDGSADGPGAGGGGGEGGDASARPVEFDPASLRWALLAILLVAGVAAAVMLWSWWRARAAAETGASPAAATAAAAATERAELARLLHAPEAASAEAVMVAYRSFLAWAAALGHGIRLDETPREHGARVATAYRLPPDQVRAFIGVYEKARLSLHAPTPADRDAALRFSTSLDNPTPEEGS